MDINIINKKLFFENVSTLPAEQARQAHIKNLVDLPDPSLADLADLAHRPLPVGMQVVNEPKFIPTPAQSQWHNDLKKKN